MVDSSLQAAGMSWKSSEMEFSDHADVVLKKSDGKILSGDKVMLILQSAFFSTRNLTLPEFWLSAS